MKPTSTSSKWNIWAAMIAIMAALPASATILKVEASPLGRDSSLSRSDDAVRTFTRNLAILTRGERELRARTQGQQVLASIPVRVQLTRNGQPVPPPSATRGGTDITLQFASGARSFPTDYQAFLQDLYTRLKPRIDATFGAPSVGGNVTVSNYDVDMGDRDAIAGGYYTFDGSAQEIRFPVYSDAIGYKLEVTAVNFLHCLLLATIGPRSLPGDGWNEGIVRAAVLQIARTPGAMPPTLDSTSLEQVLQSSYEVGGLYDWGNQRALAGPEFIAPNLVSEALPIGGSRGGLYLLRYQMAGSAFQKVLVEYPAFASEFLSRTYLLGAAPSRASLLAAGQASINALGGSGSLVEGQTFAQWVAKQRILDTTLQPGTKLAVQAFPITSGLQGSEFGVFGIEAHSFRTNQDGTETLLSGNAFPIFWSPDYTRFFTSGQDDKMSFFLGYGSVAPNFPGTAFNGEPYRVTVDVPAGDQVARIVLPAGAVATAANPAENNFYGCVVGPDPGPNASYAVRISFGAEQVVVPVTHGAFGVTLNTANFELSQRRMLVELLRIPTSGATVVLNTRLVNKGPGPLALNLYVGADRVVSFDGIGIRQGLQMIGAMGEPDTSHIPDLVGGSVLAARWNPTKSKFEYYPEFGAAGTGQGFFVQSTTALPGSYLTRVADGDALTVALKPGWNLIVNPLPVDVTADTQIEVVTASNFPRAFSDAVSSGLIAGDFFRFSPTGEFAGSLLGTNTLGAGQAAYVKCLASTGATLLFRPSGTANRGGNSEPARWEIALQMSTTTAVANARIGGLEGATGTVDRYDVELPPTMGGLQISLGGKQNLYRDMRGFGKAENYLIRTQNLAAGTKVKLDLKFLRGKIGSVVVIVPGGGRTRLTKSGVVEFTVKRPDANIVVAVPRVKK